MNMNNPNRFGMSMYTLKDPIAIGIGIASFCLWRQ